MRNQSLIDIGRQAEQFQQAVMLVAQPRRVLPGFLLPGAPLNFTATYGLSLPVG